MKTLLPIILAILTLLTGCEPEVKHADSTPEPKGAPPRQAPAKAPGVSLNLHPDRITCTQCRGEKAIMIRNNDNTADFRQSCPICIGRGYRDVKLAAGKTHCPDCKGMGAILEDAKPKKSGSRSGGIQLSGSYAGRIVCARCFGTGGVTAAPGQH